MIQRVILATRVGINAHVDDHKSKSSSVRKHYDNDHAGAVPEDLVSCFKVLKNAGTNSIVLSRRCFTSIIYVKQLTPSLNVQTDSIHAKVFV